MADINNVLLWKFPDSVLRRSLTEFDGSTGYRGEFFQFAEGFVPPNSDEFIAIEDAYKAFIDAANANASIKAQIATLEASCTERRWREAIETEAGKAWLLDVNVKIAALRAQLVS
jgi:hypothetical protein